ncbi:endonuclease/exonuclease/phosphatase family protein [Dactylosporangium sp. CS-033363]|uniref:endonuclease/exonuclease/phosphatase family protein n=1 Tax=Dactylosporangium sp. CS-033363 TaxID=3239935 RepID=UPI003D948D8A
MNALVACGLSATLWAATFGDQLLPVDARPADFVVVQHNFSDENRDPGGTVARLMAVQPALVGLEEITEDVAVPLPHRVVFGTVGLWSRWPIERAEPVDIKPRGLEAEWRRGLRAEVNGVVVYVVHLPSVRMRLSGFDTRWRDDSAAQLGAWLRQERKPVVLIGDLNGAADDPGLQPITRTVTTARSTPAFSFPARMPVARIDHVMAKSGKVTAVWALNRTGSDHLPVAAKVRVGRGPGSGAPGSGR